MSETVLQTGKLVKQNLNGLTKEEYYQKKCEDLKLEKDEGDSWEENLLLGCGLSRHIRRCGV